MSFEEDLKQYAANATAEQMSLVHVPWVTRLVSDVVSEAVRMHEKAFYAQKKSRPEIVILGMRNAEGVPWKREATDADLSAMGEHPAGYVPRDGSKDRWSW